MPIPGATRPAVALRPAPIADLPLLRHWDEQPHVVGSDPNDDWKRRTKLAGCPERREQLIANVDGRSLGSRQIIDAAREVSRYWADAPRGIACGGHLDR